MESKHSEKKSRKNLSVVSLFTSYGLGDLGVRKAGGDILAMAELDARRCGFLHRNYPGTSVVEGDLWKTEDEVVREVRRKLRGEALFLVIATPPCQGMSSNGKGRINKAVREGRRSARDPRNELILPALAVIRELRPLWVVFENAGAMRRTEIPYKGRSRPILEVIEEELGPDYAGEAVVVNFASYSVPANRRRLMTIYTRDPNGMAALAGRGSLLPPTTHARPITLREAIGDFVPLNARDKLRYDSVDHHHVKPIESPRYEWIDLTPEGRTAFDNQCRRCGYAGNPTVPGKQGPHCPRRCKKCKRFLPRPMMRDRASGKWRILKCFKTSYRRMAWDKPAPTVTCNFMMPSSANNLHPDQNRTLSPAEAMVLQTVDRYEYEWGENPTDEDFGDALGEAVPPLFFEKLTRHLAAISKGSTGPGKPHDDRDRDRDPRPATKRADPSSPLARMKDPARRATRQPTPRKPSRSDPRGREKTRRSEEAPPAPTTANDGKRSGKGCQRGFAPGAA